MDFVARRPVIAGLLALVGTAVLGYFGTGLAPIPALTWLVPLPALLVVPRLPGWASAGVAFFGYLLGTANMWAFELHSQDEALWPVGVLIDVGMSAVFVLSVLAFRLVVRRGRPLSAALVAPATWTGLLYLISVLNPFGLVGTFVNEVGDVPVVLQTASVIGMLGTEFLIFLAPSAIAASGAPGVAPAGRMWTGVVAVVLLGGALGFGVARMAAGPGAGPARSVAAIATNRYVWGQPLDVPAGRALVAGFVDRINALPAGVRTVVLPEGMLSSDRADPPTLLDPMRAVARARGMDIVAGLIQKVGSVRYNFALAFPADGGPPVRYLKEHDRVSPPGHELVFLPDDPVRTGIEICGDLDFADPSRSYGRAGSRLLALPASDDGANGWQHGRDALLRGLENGQPVVWADEYGTMMISDGWGRVLADADTDGPAEFTTITAIVPAGPGLTLYGRFGDWFEWLCLAVAVGGLGLGLVRPRRLR